MENIGKDNFESTLARGAAWIGTPKRIIEQMNDFQSDIGAVDVASFQLSFNMLPIDLAEKSIELYSKEVMPHFMEK